MIAEETTNYDQYYKEMREKIFSRRFDDFSTHNIKSPTARFVMRQEFGFNTPFFVYNFLIDLTGEFGPVITPIKLEKACISLTTAFFRPVDYRGRDFRLAIMNDKLYHNILREYTVSIIYVDGFPSKMNEYGEKLPSNSNYTRFIIDSSGRAHPRTGTPKP